MWPLVETPYLLSMDADVEMPVGGLRTMYDMLRADDGVGQVGIIYEEATTHVKHGLTLMRTDMAKQLLSRFTSAKCLCQQICELLDAKGFRSVHVPSISARHARNEV